MATKESVIKIDGHKFGLFQHRDIEIYISGFTPELEAAFFGRGADWSEGAEAFKSWCEKNNLFYYSAPTELFCLDEAFAAALDKGCQGVVLENLS
ncbi:hypothetical protein [Pseudodesulfovibrio pelocollis]|uniref:hypothetical protein n=1 Tax=Pseudodesulfovibrio pelocollis TaxID=3051432 RepID=UPI00255AF7B8|nr:hypothetical protein [Pseudodesulfovibrio sp. SB368]